MKERTHYHQEYNKNPNDKNYIDPNDKNYKNPGRLVHDNLITTGKEGPKNKGNTHYQNEYRPKSAHDYKADRDMYVINRDFVRNAKPVNT